MINCTTASEERDRFKKHYQVRAFPTVVYLDPQAKELDRMKGRGAKDVEAHLRKLASPFSPFANVKELLSRDGSLQAWMRKRLAELNSDQIEVRDNAAHDLREVKRFLDAALEIASRSKDPEVQARLRQILNE